MKITLLVSMLLLSFSSLASECELTPKLLRKMDRGRQMAVNRILKRDAELNTPSCLAKMLIRSINNKDKSLIKFFLRKNPDLNFVSSDNQLNPALAAIKLKDYKTLKLLLQKGADPNLKIGKDKLLDIALRQKHYYTSKILEDFGAEETLDCSLKNNMMPKCYHKRNDAVLKVALIYYGNAMTMKDLNRIEPLLKERFLKSTNQNVSVEIISKKVLKYNKPVPGDYTYNNITDKERLQRIWYYDNVGAGIMKEVYEEYKKSVDDKMMDELDAIVGITGGQFDGLGFASGRVSVTEYPREIAWGLEDGGRVEYPSDFEIVDELIHELGHNMFLGHTSTQCQRPGLTLEQRRECCSQSPSKDDVMSYCRARAAVNETFMHGFESCNIEMIEDLIVPAMLSGGKWQVAPRTACE